MNPTSSWSQSGILIFIDTIPNDQINIVRVIFYKCSHSAGHTFINLLNTWINWLELHKHINELKYTLMVIKSSMNLEKVLFSIFMLTVSLD